MSWLKRSLYILTFILGAMFGASGDVVADSNWRHSFNDVQSLKFREADRRIPYGEHEAQFIDLWLPRDKAKAASAVVVLIHGGCWLAQYDISHIRPLATALTDHGFAVWAVEYRRVGQEGGGWPGTFEDISAAVDRLRDFRHPGMQKQKALFLGHSAGGHLALWAAGRSRLSLDSELYTENPYLPAGVVGLAAIADLQAYAQGSNSCQKVTPQFMGGSPADFPDRYRKASPAVLGTDVPVVMLQGAADDIVPPGQASTMPEAQIVEFKGAGHFDLIHPYSPAFPRLVNILNELISQ